MKEKTQINFVKKVIENESEILKKIWEILVIVLLNIFLVLAAGDSRTISFFSGDQQVYSALGSQSQEVRLIQKRLKELGYYEGAADGIFSPRTGSALKKFQKSAGLEADGKAGKKTLNALGIARQGICGCGENEVVLLARYIEEFASPADFQTMSALADETVLLLKNEGYPDTICSVIFHAVALIDN